MIKIFGKLGVVTLFLFAITTEQQYVHADIVNPDFLTKNCKSNETPITCSYQNATSTTDAYNECTPYEKNSNYYELVSEGHTFGGKVKYCLKDGATPAEPKTVYTPSFRIENFYGYVIPTLVATSILCIAGIIIIKQKNVHR